MAKTTIFLQVEDDPADAFLVAREFQNTPAHIQVRHVADGREAIRYLLGEAEYADRDTHPRPNVILLDLKLPGFDGFDFLEWLRSKPAGDLRLIPVIIMSSSDLQADVKRAYALGANSYICKPIKWDLFKERIKLLGIYWSAHVEKPEIPPT
jgi:two-component system response regulator